ncbi:MAG: glycosyltransferase [Candidatus Omnitrophota bacterium]|jgi:cellulose synthase/poly-beta-1,6-N-acetylglucosamine synthase-like glycosyltransferase
MREKPFVSIIIPIKNFERTVEKTFQYLLKINYPHGLWEIIIADGGSTDATLDIVNSWQTKYPFIKIVNVPGSLTAGMSRNEALKYATGEYIFFTDGDCAPCVEWINIMLSKFEKDPGIGAVGGEIYTLKVDKDNLTEAYCEHFKFNMVSPRYGFISEGYFPPLTDKSPTQIAGHRAYFFVTANVAYRRKALDSAGGAFWPHPTGEDIDMSLQIEQKGWRLYFAPEAKVEHMHRSDFNALRKVWYTYAMAHPALIDKHSCQKFELIFQLIGRYPRTPLFRLPFFIKGYIYIGSFHMMHIASAAFILGLAAVAANPGNNGLIIFTSAMAILALWSAYRFFYWCFFMKPGKYFFEWARMRYLTNLSFITGALKNFRKYKVLCVEPSF